jgi:hypothetical protein
MLKQVFSLIIFSLTYFIQVVNRILKVTTLSTKLCFTQFVVTFVTPRKYFLLPESTIKFEYLD